MFLSPFGMLFHNFRSTIIIISNLAKENNNYDYCWLVLEVLTCKLPTVDNLVK